MEHNFGIARVHLQEFNVTTETCLRAPLRTSIYINLGICFFLTIAVLSCVFEVFASSLRARICNIFYTAHFRQRSEFLYDSIVAGRVHRTLQLKRIVKNEVERRERLEQFYPWSYLKRVYREHRRKEPTTVRCPACQWEASVDDVVHVRFALCSQKVSGTICRSCHLDYEVTWRPCGNHVIHIVFYKKVCCMFTIII